MESIAFCKGAKTLLFSAGFGLGEGVVFGVKFWDKADSILSSPLDKGWSLLDGDFCPFKEKKEFKRLKTPNLSILHSLKNQKRLKNAKKVLQNFFQCCIIIRLIYNYIIFS